MDSPLQVGHCSEVMTARCELAMDGPAFMAMGLIEVLVVVMGSDHTFDWDF